MIDDSYKTLIAPAIVELKEKGSRFIAQAAPAADKEEAENIIAHISKKYHDATHNCFAYRIGPGAEISRYNDDGEPSGTAGKPILQAIIGRGVTNVVVVVTRYFGGTKLGTGGLIRAYGGVAAQALADARIETRYLKKTIQLGCSYSDINVVMKAVEKFDGDIRNSEYGATVEMLLQVRVVKTEPFVQFVIDQTAGRVTPKLIE